VRKGAQRQPTVEVHSERGSTAQAPSNTLCAITAATECAVGRDQTTNAASQQTSRASAIHFYDIYDTRICLMFICYLFAAMQRCEPGTQTAISPL
jgi:hypothetical protein